MASNPFAKFEHKSAFSSLDHDPSVSLASNCIRDYFGPTVQAVADCLQARGLPSTLGQILIHLRSRSDEKHAASDRDQLMRATKLFPTHQREVSVPAVRAALLVLIQHSMVHVRERGRPRPTYTYTFDSVRARLILRYPRFIEYTKKAIDETAAVIVEELLCQGKMRTVPCVLAAAKQVKEGGEKYQAVLDRLRRLVASGFVEAVPELENEDDTEEVEFEEPPKKKQKRLGPVIEEDSAVVSLLQTSFSMIQQDTVWRVNFDMYHEALRAVSLGWLVGHRFGHKVRYAGSLVTAALILAAQKAHAEKETDFDRMNTFSTQDIIRHLPKTVVQAFEKQSSDILPLVHRTMTQLATLTDPSIVQIVELGSDHTNRKYQLRTHDLKCYLHDRIVHQVVFDTYGEVAARICTILKVKGQLESDAIAEAAMVPAKDAREFLHRLYRDNYVTLFNVNQGKHHNPATMIYLWSVKPKRISETVAGDVCKCLLNLRLRRQHEVEVGKEWIERAKEADAMDENDNEADKVNYSRFCRGLERLDNAVLQLDETLMALRDF